MRPYPLSQGLTARLHSILPSRAAEIAAVLFLAIALAFATAHDAPVGSLSGRAYIRDSDRVVAGAHITLDPVQPETSDDEMVGPRIRHVKTGRDGTFTLAHVPAGDYTISAVARAHSASGVRITVAEGATTETTLSLNRSESPLKVLLHQRVYGSEESPHLSVSGYTDETKPAGTDAMRVRIWKTKLSEVLKDAGSAEALDRVGNTYDPPPTLPNELIHPDNARAPRSLSTRQVPIKDDPEGFFYETVDFSRMGLARSGPGLYLMNISHKGATACAWLLVTDTALVAKRSRNRLLGYAVDMKTGVPISGSVLRAYLNGRVVAEQTSDAHGIGVLTLPVSAAKGEESDGESQHVTLVAVRGEDEAVVKRSQDRDETSDAFTVHTYTDRPIYRPGQHVSFKSILRKTNREPIETQARYSVPAGQTVDVELRDPTGERVYSQTLTTNRFGSIAGDLEVNSEAPTGVYTMKTTIDGGEHTHDIVIASYRKPEFAVTVTPDRKRYGQSEQVRMTISAQFYFGAPVAGAKVKYAVTSSPDWSTEDATDDPGDPSDEASQPGVGRGMHEYSGATVTHGETRLDGNGKAVITFATQSAERPKFMRASETYTLTATVTEGENREAEGDGAALITPGDFHISATPDGYVTAPGQSATVRIAARDYDNKPVGNVPVEVELGYQTWTAGSLEFKRTGLQQITLGGDGRYSLAVTPPRTGEFVMKLRAHDGLGHVIVSRGSLYVSADSGGDLDTEYADLALLTDRRRYKAGDTARVLINAQRTGETVLLTIEGERLYDQQTVLMDRKSRVVYVPVRREFGPNAFIAACYVRDKHIAQSSASLRVSTPQQELHVEVAPDRRTAPGSSQLPRYGPGDRITYHIHAVDDLGRPQRCELSFGVVDEAIYALKEDDPAALRDEFYPRRSNLVSTEYSFAIQYLGDADKSEPKITARKKFPDRAFWDPYVTTDATGNAMVSFNLPDSLTTWRATATAHTVDTRLGRATNKIVSTKDFLVRLQSPRFLTQKDRSELVAFVHNNTGMAQTATVHLTTENLTVGGQAIQTIQLSSGQIGEVKWPVTADSYGDAKLTVKAWTARDASGAQYTDGLENALPIRPHGREDVQAYAGELSGSHPESEVIRVDPAAVPGLSRLTVRITPSVSSALLGATDYLVGFPYGCTEQTMSRFLPDLLVQRALKLHGIATTAQAAELPTMVRNGLQRLYRFQHAETGAWGWWEHDTDNPWMTAYVMYGMATAEAQGYSVSENVVARARKAAAKMAADVNTDLSDRAFLMYALALTGDLRTARAERSRPIALTKLRPDALAYMVLVDRLLGRQDRAVVTELSRRAVFADGQLHWSSAKDGSDWNDVGTTAVCLRALVAESARDPRVAQVLSWLMLRRNGSYWINTRDTALTLAAFCDYLASQGEVSATGSVRIGLNGTPYQTFELTPELIKEKEVAVRIAPTALRADKNDITLERVGGNSAIFYSVQFRQVVATEDLPVLANPKLQIKREYLRVVPKSAGSGYFTDQTEPTNNELSGSDWVRIRLTIKSPRDLSYVLVEDAFPAGCEVNERGDAEDVTEWGYWWSAVDVRDDRIAFFCRTLSKGEHTIEYNLRAQTPGVYHVMPAMAQGMYAPDTRAESAEARITVK